jgi:hypothetical protein
MLEKDCVRDIPMQDHYVKEEDIWKKQKMIR